MQEKKDHTHIRMATRFGTTYGSDEYDGDVGHYLKNYHTYL